MVKVNLQCPFCGSEDVRLYGHSNGKQRYACDNVECSHKTFYADYTYKAYEPGVKSAILKWSTDGAGTRAIARELGVHRDTVTATLKKKNCS